VQIYLHVHMRTQSIITETQALATAYAIALANSSISVGTCLRALRIRALFTHPGLRSRLPRSGQLHAMAYALAGRHSNDARPCAGWAAGPWLTRMTDADADDIQTLAVKSYSMVGMTDAKNLRNKSKYCSTFSFLPACPVA
jgi:hypothetical protein